MTEPAAPAGGGQRGGGRAPAIPFRTATGAGRVDVLFERGHLADIDRHFATLVAGLDDGGGPELALAAALASMWTRDGHACIALPEVAGRDWPRPGGVPLPDLDAWTEALGASPMVARPGDADRRPLVLDDRGRLYLERLWTAERTVAAGLLGLAGDAATVPVVTGTRAGRRSERPEARSEDAAPPARAGSGGGPGGSQGPDPAHGGTARDAGRLAAALDRLFPDAGPEDRARIAARTAACRRLCVVSGGPGTGKTTIAAAIVALLIELGLAAPDRIALAAPTGKAAARLQEAVRGRHRHLASRIPALEGYEARATTVHRWLHSRAREPRPIDALALDESSMVDLTLMARVLSALPGDARLVLLGDASQLASVQPGAVFADVCRAGRGAGATRAGDEVAAPPESSPLSPCVVELVRNWRFDEAGGIGRLAAAVVRGDGGGAVAALRDPADAATELRPLIGPGHFERLATTFADERFAPVLRAMRSRSTIREPAVAAGPLSAFRVLCAHRVGAFGAERFNRLVERRLRALGLVPADDAFYPGRPILVTRNDPRTRLSNGDTGVVVRDDDRVHVWFPELGEASGQPRLVAPARLPPHESFFAVTVHRAQGSEYDEVAVVLGPAASRVATRELLYTAVTRARRRVAVYGSEESVGAAVAQATERFSGLRDALVRCAGSG